MIDFLRKLFRNRKTKLRIIVIDDANTGNDESFKFRPRTFYSVLTLIVLGISIVIASIFMATPLGGFIYSKTDMEARRTINNIVERINALQDTLDVRDAQLETIKTVIRTNADTTLARDENLLATMEDVSATNPQISMQYKSVLSEVASSDLALTNVLLKSSEFPAPYPVTGSFTRGFDAKSKHYGIDIATKKDEIFTSIANGTVITAAWTISYGYIIAIQHDDGIISIYKHATKLNKQEGESVHKSDILGLVGNIGTSSLGSHLHFEIWKDGVPQNPLLYLIN